MISDLIGIVSVLVVLGFAVGMLVYAVVKEFDAKKDAAKTA